MAFVSKKPLHRLRSVTVGQKGVVTYKVGWLVTRSVSTDTQFVVLTTSGLASVYQPYAEDTRALCIDVSVSPAGDETGVLWEATETYSTQFDTNDQQANPLQRPAQYSCTSSQYTRPIFLDLVTNKPILNLAGDYYDPPPEVDDARGQIVVVHNEATLPIAKMSYVNAVNSDQFFGNGPRYWKCDSIVSGNQSSEGGVTFYPVTYTFTYNANTWKGNFLEIGYNGLADGKKVKFNSDKPLLLKDNGQSTNGRKNIGKTDDPNAAKFTEWTIYRELPFSALGFNL